MKKVTHVGLDVHKAFIQVAVLLPEEDTPIEWRCANTPNSVRTMRGKIQQLAPGAGHSMWSR